MAPGVIDHDGHIPVMFAPLASGDVIMIGLNVTIQGESEGVYTIWFQSHEAVSIIFAKGRLRIFVDDVPFTSDSIDLEIHPEVMDHARLQDEL